MAVLMFIDGVLRSPKGAPIRQGVSLYHTLRANTKVLLLCSHKERDDRWLREQKINLVDDLVGADIPMSGDWIEWRQVEYCRGREQVDYVVTSDPELVAKLLNAGITSFMFLQPTYISEKFRPDSREGKKSWDDIRAEIERQQELYLGDARIQ